MIPFLRKSIGEYNSVSWLVADLDYETEEQEYAHGLAVKSGAKSRHLAKRATHQREKSFVVERLA